MVVGLIMVALFVLPGITLAFFMPGTAFDAWLPRTAKQGIVGSILFVAMQFILIFVLSAGMVGCWPALVCAWMGIGPSAVVVLRIVLFKRGIVLWEKERELTCDSGEIK